MPTIAEPTRAFAPPAKYPHAMAFSIQLGRNLAVQGLGIGMVSLMGLGVAPWPAVLGWTAAVIAAVTAENRVLRRLTRAGRSTPIPWAWAPGLRIVATSLYATAAYVLITTGGLGERLFGFALMSASVVHVLMRYYRSPLILLASLAPYIALLGVVGTGVAEVSLREGRVLGAVAPVLTIAMIAVQFWSARAQLAGAWTELQTARETAEAREKAAEAANAAKSAFLTNMSHELRTPLNGVLGMAQALTTDGLSRTQQERVAVIRRSSENLLSILNDLLDLSKLEAGALDLEVGEFDLEHLVRGVVTAYQSPAAKKGLSFDFEIADEACGLYLGDAPRIRRILYSLADNAVKFTSAGGVVLRVGRDGGQIVFSVADTGIGIAESDMPRLFEGFFQADAALTRRYSGAGIGLAVCGQLTALMNGAVAAESRLGEGSVFTLSLPLPPVLAVTDIPAEAAETAAPASDDLRVLAAEDNPTNQLVLKTLLAPAGIAPILVENGREALAAWESQTWDLVLMDIQMPEMDGVEATRGIRQREQQTGRPRTPIVAVTANAMTHQLAQYEAAGIDAVVAKPIDMANLYAVMERALAAAAPSAQHHAAN